MSGTMPLEVDNRPILISVLSGKGGVGKSVIAFNLAYQMANTDQQVLLVDTDFSSGNIHILANIGCEYGVEQFASGQLSLSEAVTSWKRNLDILPVSSAGSTSTLSQIGSVGQFAARLRRQARHYDLVIIDHSSGVSEFSTILAHSSDLNLLVLIPELTSIADCFGLYRFLLETNRAIDCRLLLNRVVSADEADYIRSKFLVLTERFLHRTPGFAGILNEDPAVRQAVASQKPMAEVDATSRITQTLDDISNKLTNELMGPATAGQRIMINSNTAMADTKG